MRASISPAMRPRRYRPRCRTSDPCDELPPKIEGLDELEDATRCILGDLPERKHCYVKCLTHDFENEDHFRTVIANRISWRCVMKIAIALLALCMTCAAPAAIAG